MLARPLACREASCDKIATRRCFPVEHFTSRENTGLAYQHQTVIKRVKPQTTSNRYSLIKRARAIVQYRQALEFFRNRTVSILAKLEEKRTFHCGHLEPLQSI